MHNEVSVFFSEIKMVIFDNNNCDSVSCHMQAILYYRVP